MHPRSELGSSPVPFLASSLRRGYWCGRRCLSGQKRDDGEDTQAKRAGRDRVGAICGAIAAASVDPRSSQSHGDSAAYGIRSISLAFAILENLIAGNRGKGASELARELGTNKWRVFRHLHALHECGYVIQDPETDKFDVSFRLFELAIAIPRRLRLIDVARPLLATLRGQIGHSVLLAVVNEIRVMIVDGLSGDDPVQLVVVPGSQLDMHSSALGKVALAFGPPDLLEQVAALPLPSTHRARSSARTPAP